jgi:hypothetical protein
MQSVRAYGEKHALEYFTKMKGASKSKTTEKNHRLRPRRRKSFPADMQWRRDQETRKSYNGGNPEENTEVQP